MIGVFDSGLGGLTVLRRLVEELPAYEYVYLGDNARAPYGVRDPEEIFSLVRQGIEFLFSLGCPLVILACNTGSAGALRRIQQEILPETYPDHRVLGVIVPTAEFVEAEALDDVTVFATPATVKTHAYAYEILKRRPSCQVTEIACPALVPLIEADADPEAIREAVRACVRSVTQPIQTLLLGCTHYELVADLMSAELPDARLLTQGKLVASSLHCYLDRHPEIDAHLTRGNVRRFLTTGDPLQVRNPASRFFGHDVQFAQAVLPAV